MWVVFIVSNLDGRSRYRQQHKNVSLNIPKALTKSFWRQRRHDFVAALTAMCTLETSTPLKTTIIYNTAMHGNAMKKLYLLIAHTKKINTICFETSFATMTDLAWMQLYSYNRKSIMFIVPFVGCLSKRTCATMTAHQINLLIAAYIFLRRMATVNRWFDLRHLFEKHASHLSEIFCKILRIFMYTSGDLFKSPIPETFFAQHP